MNTLRGMYDGETRRPDLDVLDNLINTLRRLTGREIALADVLTWTEGASSTEPAGAFRIVGSSRLVP